MIKFPTRKNIVTIGATIVAGISVFVNMVFNDILSCISSKRIKVSLGIEEDLRGAGCTMSTSPR